MRRRGSRRGPRGRGGRAGLLPPARRPTASSAAPTCPSPRWLFALGGGRRPDRLVRRRWPTLWPTPRLEEEREQAAASRCRVARRRRSAGPRASRSFVAVVYAGFQGTQAATSNLAPTVIYVLFWVGLPVAAYVFGDVFRAFSPWRAVGARRGVGRAAGIGRAAGAAGLPGAARALARRRRDPHLRLGRARLLRPRRSRRRSRSWRSPTPGSSSLGMGLYGIDPWGARADAFGVYFGLFARLSAFASRGRDVVRAPAAQRRAPARRRAGNRGAPVRHGRLDHVRRVLHGHHRGRASRRTSSTGSSTSASTLDHALEASGRRSGSSWRSCSSAGIYNARRRGHAASSASGARTRRARAAVRPHARADRVRVRARALLLAAHLPGPGDRVPDLRPARRRLRPLRAPPNVQIDYNVITATGIWYVQVAALVVGHVAGLDARPRPGAGRLRRRRARRRARSTGCSP